MGFKTTAKFPASTGRKAYRGCPILVGIDLGNGVDVYSGVITNESETYGAGYVVLDGDPNIGADIFNGTNVPFDATADAGGDPTALSDGKWMFAASANIS